VGFAALRRDERPPGAAESDEACRSKTLISRGELAHPRGRRLAALDRVPPRAGLAASHPEHDRLASSRRQRIVVHLHYGHESLGT
jgi:hypothetical protein